MFERSIDFGLTPIHKFASKDDFIKEANKNIGERLVKIALNQESAAKKIANYDQYTILQEAAKDATVLFNKHIGLVSSVNALDKVSSVKPEEWVFFRCRAIDAGGFAENGNQEDLHGANDNGDYFSVDELLKERVFDTRGAGGAERLVKAYETFVGKLFFTNHNNSDVGEAKGMIVNAYYDLEEHCVYCDVMIDARANPQLARGIKEGMLNDVSMGCAVEWSECSICQNKAKNTQEYCEHIANHKGREIKGKKVYEINHDLKFIEISAVTEGAFKNCMIEEIISQDDLIHTINQMKEASENWILKSSHQKLEMCIDTLKDIAKHDIEKVHNLKVAAAKENKQIIIEASEEHLAKLYKSLDLLREVIMDMIQMENIDYDYVSDLTKIMKDLQASIFDLASVGFNEEDNTAVLMDSPENGQTLPEQGGGNPPGGVTELPQPGNQPAPGGMPTQNSPQKEELPLAAKKIVDKDDLNKISDKIETVINDCTNYLRYKYSMNKDKKAHTSYSYDPKTDSGVYTVDYKPVRMAYDIKSDTIKTYLYRDMVKEQSLDELPKVVSTLIRNNPEVTLEKRVLDYAKNIKEAILKIREQEGRKKMSDTKMTKESATDKIIYKQLVDDLDGSNSKHVRDVHNIDHPLFEAVLDDLDTTPETGASEYMLEGKVQKGETANERLNDVHKIDRGITEDQMTQNNRRAEDERADIEYGTTEDQLESRSGEYTTHRHQPERAEDYPPITEKQMDDIDFGNKRLEAALLSITEEQMTSKREDDSLAGSSGQTKWSHDAYEIKTAKDVADLLIESLTNVVLKDQINPSRVASACSEIQDISQYLGSYNSNSSLQQFSSPVRTENDIRNRVALRIAEINHNRGLVASDDSLNKAWAKVLNGALVAFSNDTAKLARVIASKSSDYINNLQNVVADKINIESEEDKTKNTFASILDVYANGQSKSEDSEEVVISFSEEDFIVNDKQLELGSEEWLARACDLSSEVISSNMDLEIPAENIGILSSCEEDGLLKCVASTTGKYADLLRQAKEDYVDEEDDDDDIDAEAESDEEKDIDAEASMKDALNKVYAQEAPGGYVGAPYGAPDAENAPGDPGVATMSTPPPDTFEPLDVPGGDDGGAGSGEVGEPKLPGLRCPSCGSIEQLEQVDNSIRCGVCGEEFEVEVNIKQKKNVALDTNGNGMIDEDDDFTEVEDEQNELESVPTGAPPAPAAPPAAPPMAAEDNKMKKEAAKILTRIKYTAEPEELACNSNTVFAGKNITPKIGEAVAPGDRCPNCGSSHTYKKASQFTCTECGCVGKVKIAQNADDARFVDVTIAYFASPEKVEVNDQIIEAYKAKAKDSIEIMAARTAPIKEADVKSREEILEALKQEFVQDGYNEKDAATLVEIVSESIKSEKENKRGTKAMAQEENIHSASDENLLDEALQSEAMEDDYETEEDGFEEVDDIATDDVDDVDDTDEVVDIIELDDDSDDSLEGIEDESEVNITIETPVETVNIEVEDGSVEVETGEEEFEEGLEEAPDYLGDEESLEGDLGDVAPELDEDFGDEEVEGFEGDDVLEEDSAPMSFAPHKENTMGHADPREYMQDSAIAEEKELNLIKRAALMNDKGVRKNSDGYGSTIDFDKLASMLGIDTKEVNAKAKEMEKTSALLNTKNVNFGDAGQLRQYLMSTAQAANTNQTQPLDVSDDVETDIPRDENKGLKQVDYKPVVSPSGNAGGGVSEVKTDKYEKGSGANVGGETDKVPRSPGNSGMGGQGKTDFAEEKSNKATSGHPDTYVQSVQDQIPPTSVKNENNRVYRASDFPQIKKIASKFDIPVKDIKVKRINGLCIANYQDRIWTFSKLEKSLPKEITIDFDKVEVKVSKDGSITKTAKAVVEDIKIANDNKNVKTAGKVVATASSGVAAARLVCKAQNVPEQFLEYAELDDEYLVIDTRNPQHPFRIQKDNR